MQVKENDRVKVQDLTKSKTGLIVIGIFLMAGALYLITVPIYKTAFEVAELNKSIRALSRELRVVSNTVDDSFILK